MSCLGQNRLNKLTLGKILLYRLALWNPPWWPWRQCSVAWTYIVTCKASRGLPSRILCVAQSATYLWRTSLPCSAAISRARSQSPRSAYISRAELRSTLASWRSEQMFSFNFSVLSWEQRDNFQSVKDAKARAIDCHFSFRTQEVVTVF